MAQSMTGYASSIVEIPITKDERLSLNISIKSLNSRFFEATCKLPYLLSNLEVSVQRLLKQDLHRGHVYLYIKIQQDTLKHSVIPSIQTVKGYLQAIENIKQECNIQEVVSLKTLLSLPNILQIEEEALSKKVNDTILQKIKDVTDQLISTRVVEGKLLSQDITSQAKNIKTKLDQIKKASLLAIKEKKQALDEIITELQNFNLEEQCATQCVLENQKTSLISELEKIDINEEIVRAHAHLKSLKTILASKQITKGKKLDFTLQELNREINTIASKCSHFTISSLAIDIKSELEKCREQAQNIV